MDDRMGRTTGESPDSRSGIVAATRNADKLALLCRLVGRRHELQPLPDHVEAIEPEPVESTEPGDPDPLVVIARSKAIFVSVALDGARTIASDGGLLVPELGDRWQPARTRRFAGPDASNHDREIALLALTEGLTGDRRRLGWREVVVIAEAGRVVATFVAEATPGWLRESLPSVQNDDGQGFWVPRLWHVNPGESMTTPAGGPDHWDRMALVVPPFLDGLAGRGSI